MLGSGAVLRIEVCPHDIYCSLKCPPVLSKSSVSPETNQCTRHHVQWLAGWDTWISWLRMSSIGLKHPFQGPGATLQESKWQTFLLLVLTLALSFSILRIWYFCLWYLLLHSPYLWYSGPEDQEPESVFLIGHLHGIRYPSTIHFHPA